MTGNAMAMRALFVVMLILMKAVNPAKLRAYLD